MGRTRPLSASINLTVGDGELAERAAAGELDAFEELYRRHAQAAWRVAQAVSGNAHDAADAVSEAFTNVLQALPAGRLHEPGQFRAYLLTATRNAAVDGLRRGGRVKPTDADEVLERPNVVSGPAEVVMDAAEISLVARAFKSLPERWRSVLWLTEVEKMPPKEAAELLGVSPNGVAQLAVRARAGLRERYLQEHMANGEVEDGCRYTVDRMGAYVAGGLPARELSKVDQHLAGCEECRARRDELDDLGTTMRRAILPIPFGLAALSVAHWRSSLAAAHAAAHASAPAAAAAVIPAAAPPASAAAPAAAPAAAKVAAPAAAKVAAPAAAKVAAPAAAKVAASAAARAAPPAAARAAAPAATVVAAPVARAGPGVGHAVKVASNGTSWTLKAQRPLAVLSAGLLAASVVGVGIVSQAVVPHPSNHPAAGIATPKAPPVTFTQAAVNAAVAGLPELVAPDTAALAPSAGDVAAAASNPASSASPLASESASTWTPAPDPTSATSPGTGGTGAGSPAAQATIHVTAGGTDTAVAVGSGDGSCTGGSVAGQVGGCPPPPANGGDGHTVVVDTSGTTVPPEHIAAG